MSFTLGFTETFEKIKKQTQEKLDQITAEIMRTEDEIEKFIEQTKDFEHSLKAMEGKEVKEKVVKEKAVEEQVFKEKVVCQFNKEEALASIKYSENYGCNYGQSTSWPTVDILRVKSNETLKQLRVKKIEWALYSDGDIISLRFTLNDGTTSKQVGTDKNVNKSIEFPEYKPIRSVRV